MTDDIHFRMSPDQEVRARDLYETHLGTMRGRIVIDGGGFETRGYVVDDIDEHGNPLPDATITRHLNRDEVKAFLKAYVGFWEIVATETEAEYPTATRYAREMIDNTMSALDLIGE